MRIPVPYEKCILCLASAADSWEHIIPQCVGGRLQARLLCTRCNNTFGSRFVSALRSDPSIRFAALRLRSQLPALYESIENGLPYIAKSTDGSTLRVSLREGEWRVVSGPAPDGSRVLDSAEASSSLVKYLKRSGAPEERVRHWSELLADLQLGEALELPTGHTVIKKGHSGPIIPDASSGYVSERVPALIAYEFLALWLHRPIYSDALAPVRSFIRDGQPTDDVAVERLSAKEYAPGHTIELTSRSDRLVVQIAFFRWFVFRVTLAMPRVLGFDALMLEDVLNGLSRVALREHSSAEWTVYTL